jgi:uncharacterized damage-inducible protein DinB
MHLRRLLCAGPILAICFTLALPVVLRGQEGMTGTPSTTAKAIPPAESLNALLSIMESEVVSAAEAMPADKYDFAPSTSMGLYTGVRTFSAQVKHLAESNYSFFHGFGIPGGVDPKTIEALKTKDDIVKALKDSYTYAHAAVSTITPENAFLSVPAPPQWKMTRASAAAFAMAHSMDHYGQMVEYLRMNGIVPPASRPRNARSE